MFGSIKEQLSYLVVGDIIFGTWPDGGTLLCLITELSGGLIITRRLLSGGTIVFDAETGRKVKPENISYIASIAPLPLDIYQTFMNLDRRHRLLQKEEDGLLTDVEKKALFWIADYYPANPLIDRPSARHHSSD